MDACSFKRTIFYFFYISALNHFRLLEVDLIFVISHSVFMIPETFPME